MSTVQIWVKEGDREILRRLIRYFEAEQEERFHGKNYLYTKATRRGRRGTIGRKRIMREKINESYVVRQALNSFWFDKEQAVVKAEKEGYDY